MSSTFGNVAEPPGSHPPRPGTAAATIAVQPRTGRVFPACIASPEWHLWDNCGYVEDGQVHVYAQAADRATCATPEDRYWRAYWRHFVSSDGGRTWTDEGPAILPRSEPAAYDAYTIWSGSVLRRDDGLKLAAYTGLAAGKLALQCIALAISEDGHTFRRVSDDRPLISAVLDYEPLVANGYYLGPRETLGDIDAEDDGTFLCLRDPFLFVDDDRSVHVFFGAKARRGQAIVRAVGHAVLTDPARLGKVEIRPPIFVPDGHEFNQLELPNVVRRNGSYYLVVSTTNLAYLGQSDLHADKSVRIYRSFALDEGWEPYGHGGRHVILTPASGLYGLNVLSDPANAGDTLDCRVFWVSDTSLPPSVRLTVGGDDPVLEFPGDVWGGAAG
jgi:hypothetical protein